MKEQRKAPQKTPLLNKVVNIIIPKTNASMLESLSLKECRITQDEESHIIKGNGSMYAYDIGCGGKSFKLYTPTYFDIYVIEKIGYDDRLGDFIMLKHGEYRFIYGHTYTELKEGDRIGPKTILGTTNKSGMSTGHHLHIELWKGFNNIKWQYLEGGEEIVNNKSFDLRVQRNLIDDKEINIQILEFIKTFEGCHLSAYWDYGQYSIGYGVKSYKGEVITQDEAELRTRKVIQSIRERYGLYNYNINIQKAVVSFVYNIGSLNEKQLWLLRNHYYRALANNISEYNKITIDGKKVVAGGLVKRRQAEFNLLTN